MDGYVLLFYTALFHTHNTLGKIENWIAPKKLFSKVRMGAQGWLTNEKNLVTFFPHLCPFEKISKEVIICTLRPKMA